MEVLDEIIAEFIRMVRSQSKLIPPSLRFGFITTIFVLFLFYLLMRVTAQLVPPDLLMSLELLGYIWVFGIFASPLIVVLFTVVFSALNTVGETKQRQLLHLGVVCSASSILLLMLFSYVLSLKP